MALLRNQFIQALGVAAFVYLLLQAFGWGLESILSIVSSFARWYRYYGSQRLEEIALAAGAVYLLVISVVNSK